ncbi:MAG: OmpA family protein [Planctomycetota bacterium]
MNPIARTARVLVLLMVALPITGCATRYQELLEQRDATIDDLEGQLAQCRAENEQLRRQNFDPSTSTPSQTDESELDTLRSQFTGPIDVSLTPSGLVSLSIQDEVTFDQGSIDLKPSAASTLREVANVLRGRFAGNRVYVAGHTDGVPITNPESRFRSNVHLSAERADAVRRWLIQQGGVPERRLVIVGFGPFRPKSLGSGAAADAANRRVEIIIGEDL